MPFTAIVDGELIAPHQATERDTPTCPACGNRLGVRDSHRRNGVFVARHFWHPTAPPDGCSGPGGESAEHRQMKSIAASKADSVFTTATVSIEADVGDHRADVLLEFAKQHDRFGAGIAIEVQYKHDSKDREAVQRDFQSNGYSVLWLEPDHFSERDVDLSQGTLEAWWAAEVPLAEGWMDYHNIIKWLRQPRNPTVELKVSFPDAMFSEENALLWAEGLYSSHSGTDGWSSVFSAPLYAGSRTRNEIGLGVDGRGVPRVFIRKVRGSDVEKVEDPNLFRCTPDLRRLSKMLDAWDIEHRKGWASRQVKDQSKNWAQVWKLDTGMCRLKLLCQVENGEPVVGLEDHYKGSVAALADPELASESIRRLIEARYTIRE